MHSNRQGRRSNAGLLAHGRSAASALTVMLALVAILGPALPRAGFAQSSGHESHSAHAHGEAEEAGETNEAGEAAARTEGEIRKVDLDSGKVTIRHGEISNLQMGAMTMIFTARAPKLLANLAPGDKVSFHVIRDKGLLVITEIEKVR